MPLFVFDLPSELFLLYLDSNMGRGDLYRKQPARVPRFRFRRPRAPPPNPAVVSEKP